jgi:hypothetical protein
MLPPLLPPLLPPMLPPLPPPVPHLAARALEYGHAPDFQHMSLAAYDAHAVHRSAMQDNGG